jgi:hypothetical protein
MRGYEKLNHREADLLWDGERRDRPEEELDEFFDQLNQSIEPLQTDREPCDLYGRCGECPNFEDCFGLSIQQKISRKVII